jgi:mevalonate kinase
MSRTTGRACGKVILLGEHAVVYGVPALAVGIERGARATAEWLETGPSRICMPAWQVETTTCDDTHDLGRALGAILEASGVDRPVAVEAHASLPPGGGLGCSAALGVAVARALDPRATEQDIAVRAMAWERVFHGNPSGVDAAVAAQGGCVLFERGTADAASGASPGRCLHKIEPVRVRGGITLCLGSTGRASSTKSMVDAVARLRARRPEMVAKAFEGITSLVRNARLAVEAGDRSALGRLMDLNQMILSGLFVSTQEIERLCDLARSAGALGAKLTGAGGGGCVAALVDGVHVADRVLEAWKGEGFDGFATSVASATHAAQRAAEEMSP